MQATASFVASLTVLPTAHWLAHEASTDGDATPPSVVTASTHVLMQ